MAYISDKSRKHFFPASSVHKEKKLWGEEHWIVNKEYCGKKLILKKDHRCSMHSHKEKDEVFYLQSGKVLLEFDGEKHMLNPGDFIHIPPGTPHRFTGLERSEIFEFSTTHDENDSYRSELSGHVEQERFDREMALIEKFPNVHVLVVGDAMLDTYIEGSVSRISPEAPIPIVRSRSEWSVPGGAANVSRNVVSLGGRSTLIGVCGNDSAGKKLSSLLKKRHIDARLITDRSRCTTQKQRIVGNGKHQVTRIDYEETSDVSPAIQEKILQEVSKEIRKADVLVLSDYAKGVLSLDVLTRVIAIGKKAGVPIVLDPKPKGPEYLRYARGVTLLKPNRREVCILMGESEPDLKKAARTLVKALGSHVLLTLGSDGMLLATLSRALKSFPALAREVADISGAGDTVVATLGLVLGAKGSHEDASDLANRAASIVVGKVGTATVSAKELEDLL